MRVSHPPFRRLDMDSGPYYLEDSRRGAETIRPHRHMPSSRPAAVPAAPVSFDVFHLLEDLLRVGKLARIRKSSGDELLEVRLRLRHLFRGQIGAATIVEQAVVLRESGHQLIEERQ